MLNGCCFLSTDHRSPDVTDDSFPKYVYDVKDVRPLHKLHPCYPLEARDQGIEGYVRVVLTINEDGNVKDVQVLDSQPPGVFTNAVINAIRDSGMKIKPAFEGE